MKSIKGLGRDRHSMKQIATGIGNLLVQGNNRNSFSSIFLIFLAFKLIKVDGFLCFPLAFEHFNPYFSFPTGLSFFKRCFRVADIF